VRARAWQYLCGGKYLLDSSPGRFDGYLAETGNPQCVEEIRKDLHRQFPLHELFMARGGHGSASISSIQLLLLYLLAPSFYLYYLTVRSEWQFGTVVSVSTKLLYTGPGYYLDG